MDIPRVLSALGLDGEDQGPGANSSSTYAQLAAGWRGSVPCPTLAEMEAAWAALVAEEPEPMTEQERRQAIDALSPAERDTLLREVLVERTAHGWKGLARRGVKLRKRTP